MVSYRLVAFAGLAAALPLNINLGAYSPALVVGMTVLSSLTHAVPPKSLAASLHQGLGDGEISFGGKQDVSNLMNALEGAAVNAAVGATTTAPATTVDAPAVVVPAADSAGQPPSEAVVAAASPGSALAQQVRIPFFLPWTSFDPYLIPSLSEYTLF